MDQFHFFQACCDNDVEVVRRALTSGFDPNFALTISPLAMSAWKRHVNIMELLIPHITNINELDHHNDTP